MKGEALIALDEQSVRDLIPVLKQYGVESIAIGFIHAYCNISRLLANRIHDSTRLPVKANFR